MRVTNAQEDWVNKMSGLLDKANETAKEVEITEDENLVTPFATTEEKLVVDKKITISLQVAGIIGLLVSVFLLIQVGWLYATSVSYTHLTLPTKRIV